MLMEQEADRLSDTGRRYLQTCIASAQRMGQMVDDLLAFSRLGRQALSVGPVDMTALVREVWEEAINVGGSKAQLKLGQIPPAVGDRAMLREVWANLISNAVKYSTRTPDPVVEIDGALAANGPQYSIHDNGVGFDMTYARKLFRVFERLHTNSDFEGTGAGLAIVERILHRHGGRVWAESELGKGATFHFTLPPRTQPAAA
jgi:light-regulated signal transduction histidine kinase (bacteriophytochrome)